MTLLLLVYFMWIGKILSFFLQNHIDPAGISNNKTRVWVTRILFYAQIYTYILLKDFKNLEESRRKNKQKYSYIYSAKYFLPGKVLKDLKIPLTL